MLNEFIILTSVAKYFLFQKIISHNLRFFLENVAKIFVKDCHFNMLRWQLSFLYFFLFDLNNC